MDQHIRIISIIDIIYGALLLLVGLGVGVIASILGVQVGTMGDDSGPAGAFVTAVGVGIGVFLLILGLLAIIVGVKLKTYQPWTRTAQIVIGILFLPNFPLGTAFGVYSLWAMLSDDSKPLFFRHPSPA